MCNVRRVAAALFLACPVGAVGKEGAMSSALHTAWEAALVACDFLGLDSGPISRGAQPAVSDYSSDRALEQCQRGAVECALLLRGAVRRYELSRLGQVRRQVRRGLLR